MSRRARLLAGLLAATGVLHLVRPQLYDPIIPRVLPGAPRAWTYVSGVAELTLAAALMVPAGRRRAAQATAVFFVVVFPANVQMALDGGAIAWARLPLQLPLILWALSIAKRP